ncbi:MAG: YtxH domain-containing protein [Thermodesulfobacteriota bacterium]
METTKRGGNNFLTGLLIGSAVGGLAGLLFAPKSGKELRDDIKTSGQKAFEETKGFIGRVNHQVSEKSEKAKNIWSCIKGEASPQYRVESAEESAGEA